VKGPTIDSGSLYMTVELSPNGTDWFAQSAWNHPTSNWQCTIFDSPSTSHSPLSPMDDAVRFFKRLKDHPFQGGKDSL
jgi:hypothetical protein